jgi:hypothetical protein
MERLFSLALALVFVASFFLGCSESSPVAGKQEAGQQPKSDYMKSYNKAKSTIDQVNKIQQDRYGSGAR